MLLSPVWRYWRSSWTSNAEEDIWGKVGSLNGFANACLDKLSTVEAGVRRYRVPEGGELSQVFPTFPWWLKKEPWQIWDICEEEMAEYIRKGPPVATLRASWSMLSNRLDNETRPTLSYNNGNYL